MKNSEKEILIYEFWNTFKGQQTTTKVSRTGTLIHWRSHNNLTHDMRLIMRENLKNYSVEDMCAAIHNYARALLAEDTWWTHAWPLATFFSVKEEKNKDAYKKWWRWTTENYDHSFYLSNNFPQKEQEVSDLHPDLTIKLTRAIQKWRIVKKGFTPSSKQINQLRLTTQKMVDFYKDRSCKDESIWIEDLYDCLNDHYLGKGGTVNIGLLCSDHLWNILMTQLLRTCGNV